MKTRMAVLTLGLALVLVVGGLVVASNMGFKFVPNYSTTGTDYWISVSYNNQYSLAEDICTDVGPTATTVSRFDTSAGLRFDWLCPGSGSNFPIVAGEGLFLRVNAPTTPVLVGSHDPTVTIPAGGFSVTGTDYFLSIPYHTTASKAEDICTEVGPTATTVSRFETSTGLRFDWLCPGSGNNFPITIGEALAVRVNAATAGFLPSHY